MERLFAQKTAVQTGIVFTVLSGGLLLFVTLLRDTAYLPSFLASNTAYFIAVLVLYGVVLAANIPNLIQGFSFKNGVRYDFPIVVAAILRPYGTAVFEPGSAGRRRCDPAQCGDLVVVSKRYGSPGAADPVDREF